MTEPSYLAAVRDSYDTVAAEYVLRVKDPSELDPLSRAMLAAFAELVRAADRGPVADLGCGPGKVTAHLASLDVPVCGIDVSPEMIELARRAYPDLRFTVGSMTALELDDDALGGILAYYSTHHTPPPKCCRSCSPSSTGPWRRVDICCSSATWEAVSICARHTPTAVTPSRSGRICCPQTGSPSS